MEKVAEAWEVAALVVVLMEVEARAAVAIARAAIPVAATAIAAAVRSVTAIARAAIPGA